MQESELLKWINDQLLAAQKSKERDEKILNEYKRLEKYLEILEPYLQSETAKVTITSNNKEISYLTDIIQKLLTEEIENTRQYLSKKVGAIFHEELINLLYNKLDPHPKMKEVRFVANLEAEKPTLDVYVTDGASEHLIPNLYFSTAQTNILSLSIFLATALTIKEYDCILIDDPIQSLDSINILSTIDLIRSIIVNEKKQIILSTHDENFHQLLMKKIPPSLFRSKFLELETFGKVKSIA